MTAITDTVEPVDPPPAEAEPEVADEAKAAEEAEDGVAEEAEDEPSVTELLEQLGIEVGTLAFYETRLAASRHRGELRQAGLGLAAAGVVVVAFLAAFVLANASAVGALTPALADWGAPLVLAAGWTVVGVVVSLVLRARAKRIRAWDLQEAEAARAEAEQAVRATLERLTPVITREIALSALPVAGNVADGVLDAGEDLIEGADDIVESLTEGLPGGGVVNQVWDVVLMPGRFGVRIATTVLRR
jgi:hypothetical protein